jgi:hypothetical protein
MRYLRPTKHWKHAFPPSLAYPERGLFSGCDRVWVDALQPAFVPILGRTLERAGVRDRTRGEPRVDLVFLVPYPGVWA